MVLLRTTLLAKARQDPWLTLLLFSSMVVCGASMWAARWGPFGDLGGHVEVMDVFARGADPATAYPDTYRVEAALKPNVMSGYVARWAYPLLDASQCARLLLTFYAVSLPLSLLALCWAFGRNAWLSLAGAPLVYNAMLNMGVLNFLVGLPLMFFSIAAARRFIDQGGYRGGLVVGALLVLTYWAHLFTGAMAFAFVAALLVIHVQGHGDWLRLSVLAGIGALLLAWYVANFETLHWGAAVVYQYDPIASRLSSVHADWLRFFRNDPLDEIVAGVLLLGWVVATVLGARSTAKEPGVSLRTYLRHQDFRVLALGSVVAWLVLPSHSTDVHVIHARVVPVAAVLLVLWPSWPRGDARFRRTSRVLGASLGVLAVGYPAYAAYRFGVFERAVVGDLPAAIAALSDGTMLGYSSELPQNPITYMGPTWHIPAGIHAVENGGITNDSFAARSTTAVQYADFASRPPAPIREFWRGEHLVRMDYALWRGREPHSPELGRRTRLLFHQGPWWLYQVRPVREWKSVELNVGPTGARSEVSLDCGGEPLAGLAVHERRALVAGVRAICKAGKSTVLGAESGPSSELKCPAGLVMRGVHGRVGDLIDAIGPVCGRPRDEARAAGMAGGQGGEPFFYVCPSGFVVTRVSGELSTGRAGLSWHCSELR